MKLISARSISPDFLMLAVYALLIGGFVFLTGTVFSGFHLLDDQILIRFNNHLQGNSFVSTAFEEIKNDLYARFRPLAILYYVSLARFAYPNFTAIACLVAVQGIFSCYFFYRFARYLGCGRFLSFLFPLFIFAGNQGVLFWRNCVNETFAIFLLSISFFYLGRLFNDRSKRRSGEIMFSIFLFLSTLTKESFIILVPAVLFLKIWIETLVSEKQFSRALKENLTLVSFFLLVMLLELGIIFYYKNHSNRFIRYISIDETSFSISHLATSIWRLWVLKGYLVVIIPAVFLLIKGVKSKFAGTNPRAFIVALSFLFLLITVPQVLLYSKSLIFERYLLPGTLGAAIFIIFLQLYIQKHGSLKFLNKIFIQACLMVLLIQTGLMTRDAVNYADTGNDVRNMLSVVMHNSSLLDTFLIVANAKDQSEQALSVKNYLNAPIGGNRKNIFIEPVVDTPGGVTEGKRMNIKCFLADIKDVRLEKSISSNKISGVIFFENTKPLFVKNFPQMDTTLYSAKSAKTFIILIKKH